jgi:hypothetical protein
VKSRIDGGSIKRFSSSSSSSCFADSDQSESSRESSNEKAQEGNIINPALNREDEKPDEVMEMTEPLQVRKQFEIEPMDFSSLSPPPNVYCRPLRSLARPSWLRLYPLEANDENKQLLTLRRTNKIKEDIPAIVTSMNDDRELDSGYLESADGRPYHLVREMTNDDINRVIAFTRAQ